MSFSKTLSEIASQGVTAAEFDALDVTTGAAGATTFLRGDKQWQTAGSTDASDLDTGTLLTARLPAKTIIDYSTQVLATSHTSSGAGWNIITNFNTSITVASTSDRIFALATGGIQAYSNDATTEPITLISLYDVTASTRLMENRCIAFYGSATEWHTSNFACSILITPSQTGTYTIRVDHKALSGSISYVRGTNEQSNASMLTLFYIKG